MTLETDIAAVLALDDAANTFGDWGPVLEAAPLMASLIRSLVKERDELRATSRLDDIIFEDLKAQHDDLTKHAERMAAALENVLKYCPVEKLEEWGIYDALTPYNQWKATK